MIPTDEIISMVEECGLPWTYVPHDDDTFSTHVDGLVAFANLVSARAAAVEREACAKVCEPQGGTVTVNGRLAGVYGVLAREIAKAIRARGDQK